MKRSFLFLMLICLGIAAPGQTIRYSKENIDAGNPNAVQLVADVSGYHHLLLFSFAEKPRVAVFNPQLQLYLKTSIDYKLKDDCDIKVVPFKGSYLLYIHTPGTGSHDLWKIDGKGNITPLSAPLQKLLELERKKSSAPLQFVNDQEKLFVLSHTYYEALGKIGTTVRQLNEELLPIQTRKVFFDFLTEEESLQQVHLTGENLFLLKTRSNEETGHWLHLMKIDLYTGLSVEIKYGSMSHMYTGPAFIRNPSDSSILLYSVVREPPSASRLQRVVLVSKLDHMLQETAPVNLLKSQFGRNIIANFMLVEGFSHHWLSMQTPVKFRRTLPGINTRKIRGNYSESLSLLSQPQVSGFDPVAIPAIRFTLLNSHLHVAKDSIVAGESKRYELIPHSFSQFQLNGRSCLLLLQKFAQKNIGLLLVHTDPKGGLVTADINVYNRYDYLLSALQPVGNNACMLPFVSKNEMGLVRISLP